MDIFHTQGAGVLGIIPTWPPSSMGVGTSQPCLFCSPPAEWSFAQLGLFPPNRAVDGKNAFAASLYKCEVLGWRVVVHVGVPASDPPREVQELVKRQESLSDTEFRARLQHLGFLSVSGRLFELYYVELARLKVKNIHSTAGVQKILDYVQQRSGQKCKVSVQSNLGQGATRISGDIFITQASGGDTSLSSLLVEEGLAQSIAARGQTTLK